MIKELTMHLIPNPRVPRSKQLGELGFNLSKSGKYKPRTPSDIVVKSKLSPGSGSTTLGHLNH